MTKGKPQLDSRLAVPHQRRMKKPYELYKKLKVWKRGKCYVTIKMPLQEAMREVKEYLDMGYA